jgi:hypothetical protein
LIFAAVAAQAGWAISRDDGGDVSAVMAAMPQP